MTEFVVIKPGLREDGKPHRVPMPGGYGLPYGAALPEEGWRVPLDHFVQNLLHHKDAVLALPDPSGAAAADKPADAGHDNASEGGNAA